MQTICDAITPKTALLVLLASILFITGYFPVFLILVNKWIASEEYMHAFFIVPIIFYMVWSKRAALVNNPVRYSSCGLFLLVFSTSIYLFALLTQVHTLIAIAMCLTIIGAIAYIAGAKAVKVLAMPLVLLMMLIPVPDQLYTQITFPLQLKVSQMSEMIIRGAGVPIFREGNILTIPEKSFEVVEACSGMRSMITMLTLSVIMGYFILSKSVSKLVLVTASVPTAIFVNIIRVVSMILLFHFFRMDLSEGALHTVMGIMIFGIGLIILFLLQQVLE